MDEDDNMSVSTNSSTEQDDNDNSVRVNFALIFTGDLDGLIAKLSSGDVIVDYEIRVITYDDEFWLTKITAYHSLLSLAVQGKQNHIVEFLLSQAANPNLRTPLARAAEVNNLDAARMLLADPRIIVDQEGDISFSSFERNSTYRRRNDSSYIIRRSRITNRASALLIAMRQGYIEMVRLLLASGATILEGYLHHAFIERNSAEGDQIQYEIIKELVQYGADFNNLGAPKFSWDINEYRDTTCLILAMDSELDSSVGEFLIQQGGANVHQTNHEGHNALFYAVSQNLEAWVVMLIRKGVDVNCVDDQGRTPIYNAKDLGIARFLLENGADINRNNAMRAAFGRYTTNTMEWLDLFESIGHILPEFVSFSNGDFPYYFFRSDCVTVLNKLLQLGHGHLTPSSILSKTLSGLALETEYYFSGEEEEDDGVQYLKEGLKLLLDHGAEYTYEQTKQLVTGVIDYNLFGFDFWANFHFLKCMTSVGITINFRDESNHERGLLYRILQHIDHEDDEMTDLFYKVIDFVLKHGSQDINASLQYVDNEFPDGFREKILEYLAELNTTLDDENIQDINEVCPTGHARLHYAVLQGNLGQVMSLVHRGASWNLKNRFGESAVELAIKYDRRDMVDFFRDRHNEMVPIYVLEAMRRRNDLQQRPYTRARARERLLHLPIEMFQNVIDFFFN
jgi:ankyrin repeat protein